MTDVGSTLAARAIRFLKRTKPDLFREYHALQRSKANLREAEKQLREAQTAWDVLGESDK